MSIMIPNVVTTVSASELLSTGIFPEDIVSFSTGNGIWVIVSMAIMPGLEWWQLDIMENSHTNKAIRARISLNRPGAREEQQNNGK